MRCYIKEYQFLIFVVYLHHVHAVLKLLPTKSSYLNFQPLEVVSRGSETQLQVGGIFFF